jgi:hypothetical protein
MNSNGSRPRSLVAYDLARRLIYHTAAVDLAVSPVRSAQTRLDTLLVDNRLTASDHQELSSLLRRVEGCDLDHCHAKDELVMRLAGRLASLERDFPDGKLVQLTDLM